MYKCIDIVLDSNEMMLQGTNNVESSALLAQKKLFLVASGGSGKTVTMWNACQYVLESNRSVYPRTVAKLRPDHFLCRISIIMVM